MKHLYAPRSFAESDQVTQQLTSPSSFMRQEFLPIISFTNFHPSSSKILPVIGNSLPCEEAEIIILLHIVPRVTFWYREHSRKQGVAIQPQCLAQRRYPTNIYWKSEQININWLASHL